MASEHVAEGMDLRQLHGMGQDASKSDVMDGHNNITYLPRRYIRERMFHH